MEKTSVALMGMVEVDDYAYEGGLKAVPRATCEVLATTASTVSCVVQEGLYGTWTPRVVLGDYGLAEADVTVEYLQPPHPTSCWQH